LSGEFRNFRSCWTAPDPRGPRTERVAGREETVAHELVRVTHLLCHPPAERGTTQDETLVAEVPVPTELLACALARGVLESRLLPRPIPAVQRLWSRRAGHSGGQV